MRRGARTGLWMRAVVGDWFTMYRRGVELLFSPLLGTEDGLDSRNLTVQSVEGP